jgi:toxin-antitoxin system PIN domain toxin
LSHALPDVNVLIALLWPAHAQHGAALGWFRRRGRLGWATCPHTEIGFIRIVSNPAFSRDAVSPGEAAALLRSNTSLSRHQFWPEEDPPSAALAAFGSSLQGHQQVADAYLLQFAAKRGGRLATFDRGLSSLVAPDLAPAAHLEIIPV